MIQYNLLLDPSFYKKEIESANKHRANKALGFSCYENALILPCKELASEKKSGGGIVTSDGVYISESGIHNGSHFPYDVDKEQIVESDETVVYFGMIIGIWGHCISDCIKRAWFFQSAF